MSNNKYIFITTPIYYVNAKPHIGHAYTTVVCDVYARFCHMMGYNVKFSTGTDEHGKKVEQSAKKNNRTPQQFADEVSALFKNLLPILNITNDDFIRTTEFRHKKTVEHFWKKLYDAGYIYLGEYKGWYDIQNEAYFTEKELVDGKSPLGGNVVYMEEPCYFFKLSAFGDRLLAYYEEHPDFIFPASRRNEMISFIRQGLTDLAISRTTFSWGIPVPNDPKHVVYVWLDALTNYLTVNGYPTNENQNEDPYWQNVIHFVGKEIVRFHAIYWVAFLMAVGINPPQKIVSHGWWLSEGQKMSKSLGNVQNPYDYCAEFGSDALRYYLLRELTFGSDGNFSRESFINRYNSILANSYGNLCNRVLSFIQKYCNGTIERPVEITDEDEKFYQAIDANINVCPDLIHKFSFNKYLEKMENAITLSNQYIDFQKPWTFKTSDKNRMNTILYVCLENIYKIAIMLSPVIPSTAEKLMKILKLKPTFTFDGNNRLPNTVELNELEILFPKH